MHVGGKAGVLLGGNVSGTQPVGGHQDAARVLALDARAGGFKLVQDGVQVLAVAVGDGKLAASDGGGNEESAGLDAVADDAVLRPTQALDTANTNGGGAVAFDLRPHRSQQPRQVGDLRLAGGVFQNRFTFGQAGGHHQVLGAGNADLVEEDVGAAQAVGAGEDVAVLDFERGAQPLQRFQVQINRTRPDGTAARQRNARLAAARQQRPQRQHRSAHGL